MLRSRWRTSFAIPRYTPADWWECDIAEITKSGYLREYEVKISRSDFLADCRKTENARPLRWEGPEVVQTSKHDLLAAKSTRGPVQFWFVVPEGMIRLNEVPEWAGLIECSKPNYGRYLYERETMKAPRLHNTKLPDKVVSHARGVCYYRYQGLLHLKQQAIEMNKTLRAFGWPKVKPLETKSA